MAYIKVYTDSAGNCAGTDSAGNSADSLLSGQVQRHPGTKEQDDWKKIRGEGQISWLFHGVVLRVVWAEGNLQTSFRLFGIPVDKILNRRKKNKEHSLDSSESEEDQREVIEPGENSGEPGECKI